ncbi:MAG TPA: methylmalonyl-CoA mutase small subunit [Bacteroidaceae bacterium]|nr:methylmalonyl-CoA mutase small subunit [Bacteroidaceae bacterium]
MAESKEKLFSDFAPTSTQEWKDKIQVDLKGADFEKRLVWKTNEGFKVQPLYRKEDLEGLKTTDALPGEFPYLRGTKKDNVWFVRQDIVGDSAEAMNAKAKDVLMKGIDSLSFTIPMKEVNAEFIAALLDGIAADCVELNFSVCQGHVAALAGLLVAYFTEKGYDLATLQGSINYDFFGRMLANSKEKGSLAATAKTLIDTLAPLKNYRVFTVNGLLLNNAGSFIAQELGNSLAWGNEWMQTLTEAGMDATEVANRVKFTFGVGSNYFLEIAKFRAARMLWATIVSQYTDDKEAAKARVHAETSTYNMTMFDANVNMLRSQTEAMSATLAGVDSLTVAPYDKVFQAPSDFSERIARNQQLLLKEESHFDKVVDPSAGSYYIEHVTDAIAQEAWKIFLDVESQGGFYAAVKAGTVQKNVNASNERRHTLVAQRREQLLGTNEFPNFTEMAGEKRPNDMDLYACNKGAERSCGKDCDALDFSRESSEFEKLRLETEMSGKRPKAFMLTIGNLAMRQARAQFACNFLACAGYEVVDNLGFETVEAGAEAAKKAGADIVVICSSDDEYAEYAVPAFKAVGDDALFIVAGNPKCADDLRAAGIENFIHVRVNVLETLQAYNAKLLK